MDPYYKEQAEKMSLEELNQFINMTAESWEKEALLSLSLKDKIKAVAEILDDIVEDSEEDA